MEREREREVLPESRRKNSPSCAFSLWKLIVVFYICVITQVLCKLEMSNWVGFVRIRPFHSFNPIYASILYNTCLLVSSLTESFVLPTNKYCIFIDFCAKQAEQRCQIEEAVCDSFWKIHCFLSRIWNPPDHKIKVPVQIMTKKINITFSTNASIVFLSFFMYKFFEFWTRSKFIFF